MSTSSNSLTDAIKARESEFQQRKNHPKRLPPITDHKKELLSRNEVAEVLIRPDLKLGVDRLRVTFPVLEVRKAGTDWWQADYYSTSSSMRVIKGTIFSGEGHAWLGVAGGPALTATLEFNPSTLLFGAKSLSIATLEQALDVLQEVVLEVDYLVRRPKSLDESRLSRIDIATDIPNVQDPQGVLRTLNHYGIPPRRKMRTHSSKTHGLESISCLTKSQGGYRVYNKSLQTKTPGSTVRFEVQANRDLLKEVCPTVGDLSENRMREIFTENTKTAVAALKTAERGQLDVILSSDTETEVLIDLIGIEVLRSAGRYVSLPPHRIRHRYKPFLERYNCTSVLDLVDIQNLLFER
jgi:hypothetical protein